MKRIELILIALVLVDLPLFSQKHNYVDSDTTLPPNWAHYTKENSSISENDIVDISEDTIGNIWVIAGRSNKSNIAMFDGKNWVSFNEEDGLASNKYRAIMGDSKGNVWVATSGGVCKYDGKNWSIAGTFKDFFYIGWTRVLLEDSKGNIWVGTFYQDDNPGGGVLSYDGSKWTEHKVKGITKSLGVNTIIEDSKNRIWVGVGMKNDIGRIRSFDGEKWTLYKPVLSDPKNGPPDKFVTTITEDRDGNIWVGDAFERGAAYGYSDAGSIRKYDGNEWKTIYEEIGSPKKTHLKIRKSILDKDGNIWFIAGARYSGYIGGVYKYDGANWLIYTTENGLSSNYVVDIIESKDGCIWIATDEDALNVISRFDGNNWIQEFDGAWKVSKLFADRKGNIWFGTISDGLFKYSPSK